MDEGCGLENARSINQDVSFVICDNTLAVHFNLPLFGRLIPDRFGDRRIELNISVEVILDRSPLNVRPYFRAFGIKAGPIWIWFEREGVDVCEVSARNIPARLISNLRAGTSLKRY